MTCSVSGTSDDDFGLTNAAVLGSGNGDLGLVSGDGQHLVEAMDLRDSLGDWVGAKIRPSTSNGLRDRKRSLLAAVQ